MYRSFSHAGDSNNNINSEKHWPLNIINAVKPWNYSNLNWATWIWFRSWVGPDVYGYSSDNPMVILIGLAVQHQPVNLRISLNDVVPGNIYGKTGVVFFPITFQPHDVWLMAISPFDDQIGGTITARFCYSIYRIRSEMRRGFPSRTCGSSSLY